MAFFPKFLYRETTSGLETLGYMDANFEPALKYRLETDIQFLNYIYNATRTLSFFSFVLSLIFIAFHLMKVIFSESISRVSKMEGAAFINSFDLIIMSVGICIISTLINYFAFDAMKPMLILQDRLGIAKAQHDYATNREETLDRAFDAGDNPSRVSIAYPKYTKFAPYDSTAWAHGINYDYYGQSHSLPPRDAPLYFWRVADTNEPEHKVTVLGVDHVAAP